MAEYDEYGGEIVGGDKEELDEYGGVIVKPSTPAPAPAPAPKPAPRPETPFLTAVGRSVAEAVPFAPQLTGVTEQGIAEARKDRPFTTAATRFGTTLGEYAVAARLGGPVGVGGLAALQEASALQREGKLDFTDPATYAKLAAAGVFGAAIPKLFKGADTLAKSLAPEAATPAIKAGVRRVGQALVRTAPPAALAVPQAQTFLSPQTDESGRLEALANVGMLGTMPLLSTWRGATRMGAERAGSIAEQAEQQARNVIAEGEAKRGQAAIEQVRAGETKAEAARSKAAEQAIAEQRAAETKVYEESVGLETGKELQSRSAAKKLQDLETNRRLSEEARVEKQAARDSLEQQVEQVKDTVRRTRMGAEDDALTFAQQKQDVATEAKIWEQKNKRAMRAVKDEQRVISDAERLARGDQAAVAEMQAEIAELKAMEDALTTGDDPSLRGAVAKKYQDMGNRLERALKFFKDGGVEPPPEYQQAYDSVRESYLRNTQAQGYVGFGPSNELFLEDPRAWAESERLRRRSKVEADRTGKEAAIVRFLEGIAQRDYMAESRTTRAGPQVPEQRIQELFGEQGLQYAGGPLVQSDGVPIKQPFLGGRVPRAPFTSPEVMAESIRRRRQLQDYVEAAREAVANLKRTQGRTQTAAERKALEQQAALQAQQTAGFSGLTERQAAEQAVRGRMPAPAGLPEADILARAGVSPTPATPFTNADILRAANVTPAEAARLLSEQRAAARNVAEFGTPTPKPSTQRRMDLESTGRALLETAVPSWLRGDVFLRGVTGRISGSNITRRTLPEYSRWTSPTMSTEARMETPFEAYEIAGAFERLLKADAAVDSNFRKFVERNPGATWFSYLRANPVVAAKVEAERQAAAEGATP
jgi:hypothetical protein